MRPQGFTTTLCAPWASSLGGKAAGHFFAQQSWGFPPRSFLPTRKPGRFPRSGCEHAASWGHEPGPPRPPPPGPSCVTGSCLLLDGALGSRGGRCEGPAPGAGAATERGLHRDLGRGGWGVGLCGASVSLSVQSGPEFLEKRRAGPLSPTESPPQNLSIRKTHRVLPAVQPSVCLPRGGEGLGAGVPPILAPVAWCRASHAEETHPGTHAAQGREYALEPEQPAAGWPRPRQGQGHTRARLRASSP